MYSLSSRCNSKDEEISSPVFLLLLITGFFLLLVGDARVSSLSPLLFPTVNADF